MQTSVGVVIGFSVVMLVSGGADAASQTVSPVRPNSAPDAVVIDGPPPPSGSDVANRDERGRATFRATRINAPMRIDGNLSEEVYQNISSISGFTQMEPNNGAPSTEATEAWILFDDDTLYVTVKCWDSAPERRWVANEMRRDSRTISRQNEAFHIAFDTFYDRRNALLFTITPIGGIFDGQITNETVPANSDWNPVWDRAVGRFDGGWTAEMAIPFKSLRYKPGREQTWGMTMLRLVRWKNEQSFVVPLPRNVSNGIFQVSRYATLVGIEAPAGSRNLELKPYAIATLTNDPVARPRSPITRDAHVGMDLKYGLTQNLTADLTYNTDFAQVEVDEQQVNLTRFSLFFPEKRDFFLESAGVFEFGGGTGSGNVPALFYSRQIGTNRGVPIPVEGGGRLTGKIGRYSIGALTVQTGPRSDLQVPRTNFSVVRLRRDVFRRSNVGLLVTERTHALGRNGANVAYGVDGSFGFFNSLNLTGYFAGTQTPITPASTSYRANLNYNADRWGVQIERLTVGANFNPEVGFVRRRNFKESLGSLRFSPRPRQSRRVRRYSSQVGFDYVTDDAGRFDTRLASGAVGITLQSGDSFDATVSDTAESLDSPFTIARGVTIPVGSYRYQQVSAAYLFGIQRKVSGTVSVDSGTFYSGVRNAVGYRAARIEVSPRLSLEPSVSINFVSLPEGKFVTRLVASRLTWTVTPRMFVTGLAQYNSTSSTVSSNLRLRWEYHPGSELFVVYTDEHDTGTRAPVAIRNKAIAMKVNRLLRF